jgi:hypothetical protein
MGRPLDEMPELRELSSASAAPDTWRCTVMGLPMMLSMCSHFDIEKKRDINTTWPARLTSPKLLARRILQARRTDFSCRRQNA